MKCTICNKESRILHENLFDDRYGAPGRYAVYQCSSCGFGRLFPSLGKQEISHFYAKYYPLAFQTAESIKNSTKIPSHISAWLKGINNTAHWYIRPGSIVLDVGCGCGASLLEIEKLGGTPYGVEPDPNAQKIAQKLKLNVYQGFITDNPFPGKKFDYITATQVIEHDPDPKAFLKAVYNKLENNGKVIMSFPNMDSLYRILFGRRWINWHIPFHCNFFTKKTFIRLVDSVGFRIQKIITITPNDWTITQILMFFQKRKEGKTGFVWKMINDGKTNPDIYYIQAAKKLMRLLISIPVTLINRLIDFFGRGDSFLVVLEK